MPLVKAARTGIVTEDAGSENRSLPDLLELLNSEDVVARQSAARALADHPISAPSLCDRLGIEDDAATREALSVSLTRMGGPVVITGLLPFLRSQDPALRNIVIDILKELPDDVAPHMAGLLNEPDSDVRIFAINVLETLRHLCVEDWLLAVVRADQQVNVVATALDLLCEVGTEAAIPALKSVIARFPDEPFIAFAATTALERIQRQPS